MVRQYNRAKLKAERLNLRRKAIIRSRDLNVIVNRTAKIRPSWITLFATLRNERIRIPYFLNYYRKLGVNHFLFVDNGSTDGSREYLSDQADVSLWHTEASYKRARYGVDWINALLARYGVGHWVLVVDLDEFLVYPYMDTRPLPALTDWLASCRIRSFGTLLLDMYADKPVLETPYREGEDPFQQLAWFDAANYSFDRNGKYKDLWIQGGPRQRVFFPDRPDHGPALNKIPLVKWEAGTVYRSSTHTLMPRGLNQVYSERGGERICGVLLHAKFLDQFGQKAREEVDRGEHYAAGREYRVYDEKLNEGVSMWTPQSTRYGGWQQLEGLGLLSAGGWA